jgi:dienelactone hydrolase
MGFSSRRDQLLDDIQEVRFWVEGPHEDVPGLVYLPRDADARLPLVLMQHPGMGSKDDYFVAEVARQWARRGWVCGGIDAPMHGDREDHDPMALFRDRERYPEIAAQFAEEVTDVIDALAEELPVDTQRLGYVGYSLGSMLGVPAVALDGRFGVASFCLVGEGGLVGPATGESSVVRRLDGVAVRIVAKANDELVPRSATEALYAAIPGEKDIVWLPGGHFEIGPDVIKAAVDWVKDRI